MRRHAQARHDTSEVSALHSPVPVCDVPCTAQGGVLKYGYYDLVYCNCMQVPMYSDDVHDVCNNIDEYIKFDQHRSQLLSQVTAEDMKAERRMHGDAIICNHTTACVTAMDT